MYNNIGLTTPKGSGTNGYVQRNLAGLRAQRVDFKELNKSLKHGNPDFKPKAANPELLLHEQKRKVELDLFKLEDELKAAGMSERDTQDNVAKERKQMIRAVEDGQLHYETELEKKDSHQLAVDKQNEIDRFERAFGINRGNHVFGQAFDQELQAKTRLERMEQRAAQERFKMEAARKAEKAERRALKLRAKAEKAKKKAEAKLAKLKVKQEARRIKKEQRAATKAELGVGRRSSKKEELDPDNDNGVAKATKKERDKKDTKGKKDKKGKGGKKTKDDQKKEESGEDDSSDGSDSDDSESDSDSSDDSSDSSSSSSSAKAKKKEKKRKPKAIKTATKEEAAHEQDKENRNNRPAKQKKDSKGPIKQELGEEGKGREETGNGRNQLRTSDNSSLGEQWTAQRGGSRQRSPARPAKQRNDGREPAKQELREEGKRLEEAGDESNHLRTRDNSPPGEQRAGQRDDSRRRNPARRSGDRHREDRRREEWRREDCSDSRERSTERRDDRRGHGRDRDRAERRGRLGRRDRHESHRDGEGGRGGRRLRSEDSDPRGGRRQLSEEQHAARSGRVVPEAAGQRGQQSREPSPLAAAAPRGGADIEDRQRHSAGVADWTAEADVLDRRRNARGAADALLDEAGELLRRPQPDELAGKALIPRKRERKEGEKRGVAKRAKKGKPGTRAPQAAEDPDGGDKMGSQDSEAQDHPQQRDAVNRAIVDPSGGGLKAGPKVGIRKKKPVKVTKAVSKAGRAKTRDGASSSKTLPREVLHQKQNTGEAPEGKPVAIQKHRAKVAADRRLLGYGAAHAGSGGPDDGSCSSSGGSESASGCGSVGRRAAAAAAAAAASRRCSRHERLPSPP